MTDQGQQRYRVIERLASGGMAEVFIAESAGLEGFKKQVAIKRVLPHLSEKKRFIAMFLDEARLSAQFNHSNVVQVFDIGVGDNTYFIVMEYVEGTDLKGLIKYFRENQRLFPVEAAVYIAGKICEGLAYSHELTSADGTRLNAVHRDVSPPNVLISKHGEVKIMDFGLAKASTQLQKSEAGIIKGKFSYLAPEAAHGQEVDARADIFAVGIILWEMLAGQRLFQGKSDYETVKLVQAAEVPDISKFNAAASDPQLKSIMARTLARNRDKRYRTARALGRDLTRFLYSLGNPVDAFDIAELIRAPMQERGAPAADAVSIIDKLIAETLLQFTSLRDKSGPQPASGSKPFSLTSFEDFSKWTEDQKQGDDQQSTLLVRNTLPADVFEHGNLAALEGPDEPLPPRTDSISPLAEDVELRERHAHQDEDPDRSPASPSSDPEVPDFEPPPESFRSSSPAPSLLPPGPQGGLAALKMVLLVVIAGGTAAAVWFSGLLF